MGSGVEMGVVSGELGVGSGDWGRDWRLGTGNWGLVALMN